jgi:hypothetical protein
MIVVGLLKKFKFNKRVTLVEEYGEKNRYMFDIRQKKRIDKKPRSSFV